MDAGSSQAREPIPEPGARRLFNLVPPTRSLAIRVVLSIVLAVAAYETNRSFLMWSLFAIFGLLLVPIGRARSFLFSFGPYVAIWFIFAAVRALADETILARTLNTKVGQLERWIFAGQLPTVTLQDRFYDQDHLHWYDYACTGVHWSYFIVPHLVAIRLWYRYPHIYRHFLLALTLLFATGVCVYFLIPSDPPWLLPEACNSPACPSAYRIMAQVGQQLGGGVYKASYRVIGESNPLAAMPSLHFAVTFLLVFPAFRVGKRWGLLALIYAVVMGYSLIYLGEHYFVDVTVGGLVTVYSWVAAGTWLRKVAPAISPSLASRPPLDRPVPVGPPSLAQHSDAA